MIIRGYEIKPRANLAGANLRGANLTPRVECTHGIHFFITRKEAEEYAL